MDIKVTNLFNLNVNNNTEQPKPPLRSAANRYPNLAPLKQDKVSFKGSEGNTQKVKKSDFKGVDLAVIEKFRVNISGFKSTDDLQVWASEKVKSDYLDKDFGGRMPETAAERKQLLKVWSDYVTKDNEAYTPVMQLLVLDAVTKELKVNNDVLPPTLNRGVLADTMTDILEKFNNNPNENINLNKLYRTKLKASYLGVDESNKPLGDYTGWVVIPSKTHDSKNFEDNVDKLKTLSHKNWCTKSFNARPYLEKGDFHVYLENGEPKVGIRCVGNGIQEIQGVRNNSEIPQSKLEMIKDYLSENKLKLRKNASEQVSRAEILKVEFEKLKNRIGEDAIKSNNPEKILPEFGIKVKKDVDGMYIISSYKQPSPIGFEDFGINEDELFKNIKAIKGNASFDGSAMNSLHNLKYIGGNANFSYCANIKDLGKLEKIKGDLVLNESLLESLGNLRYIGGNVSFEDTYIKSLGNVEYIGGNAKFTDSKITELANLKKVGGSLYLSGSNVSDLGKLEQIGKNANFSTSLITSLENLKKIGGNANFVGSDLKDFGDLEKVGGDLDVSYTKIKSAGDLRYVGGVIIAQSAPVSTEDLEREIYGDDFLYDILEDYGESDNYILSHDKIKAKRNKQDFSDMPDINNMEDFERYLEGC